ncbi:MAG: lysylphosphatidylglycerol synthase transmembrane domain-containing protein [Candidatus Bruticola sp.]
MSTGKKSKNSNWAASALRLTATLALIGFTLKLIGRPLTEWPSLIESMHLSISWLAAAFIILMATVVLNSYKWLLAMRAQKIRISFFRAFCCYCAGYFFNSFITGSGDIKRALDSGHDSGRFSQAWASVMLDRWSGIIGQLTLAFISLQAAARLDAALSFLSWLCMLGIIVLLAAFYIFSLLPLGERPQGQKWRLACWRIQRSFSLYKDNTKLLCTCLFFSLISPALLVASHFALAKGLSINVSLSALFYYIPAVSVFAQMPITINGFGLQDYCMVYTLKGQMNSEAALALSMAFHIIRLATGAACGLVYSLFPKSGYTHIQTMLSKKHYVRVPSSAEPAQTLKSTPFIDSHPCTDD